VSCDLPFSWDPTHISDSEAIDHDEPKARKTIEHGQLIVTRFNNLEHMDITTAEATAKLINENEIIPGLLEMLFYPGPKEHGLPCLEKVLSDRYRPLVVHASNNELDKNASDIPIPGRGRSQGTDCTMSGFQDPDRSKSNHDEVFPRIARGGKSNNNFKSSNSRAPAQPSRAVPNEIVTRKPRKITPGLILERTDGSPPTERTTAIVLKPPVSKQTGEAGKRRRKVAHVLREATHEKDGTSEEGVFEITIPSRDLAQESQYTRHEDSEVSKPPTSPAPPFAPDYCSDSHTFELSLPGPAHLDQTIKCPNKRSPKRELSDVVGDHISDCFGMHCHSQDSTEYFPSTAPSDPTSEGWTKGLRWSYATNTDADEALLDAGVWLWEKPITYFYPHQVPMKMSDPSVLAPVIVSHGSTGKSFPFIEYSGNMVYIVPHEIPWEDVRSVKCHPDFLPSGKLVEYQACEAAGYYVWRHDRDQLPCRKPDCEALVIDHSPSSVFCQGCGPKTIVRYCSFQHQIDDIEGHWVECGDPGLVMQSVIDHATAPACFFTKPPEIPERHGPYSLGSAHLKRQKTYFMNNGGYYTLFDTVTQTVTTLCWPTSDSNSQELNARIERLLIIAFFGTHEHGIITYIHRLLCELLCRTGEWTDQIKEILEIQLRSEFQDPDDLGNDLIWDNATYECECTSRALLLDSHLFTSEGKDVPTIGAKLQTSCLQKWVEQMENEYWILRAWRQQHPTEKDWRVRANGFGMIPLEPGKNIYQLGPGWTGWEGRPGNARYPDWILRQEL
jgi:hypothetical protein